MAKLPLAASLAALVFAFPVYADMHGDKGAKGQIPGLSTEPSDVVAGTYMLDPTHVNVLWTISHLGLSEYQGRFNDITGEMTIDPAKPEEASVSITIKTESIDTLSDHLDEELRSEEAFDAANHPEITFKSTKVVLQDKNEHGHEGHHAHVTGDLTMRGVTKPVTLHVDLVGSGKHPSSKKEAVGFQAIGTLKRSEFGLTSWAPVIGDEVELTIGAEFQKKD